MSNQRYDQYFDPETGVIMRPPESAGFEPYGDGVWRSSWFYASLIVLAAKDASTYQKLQQEHGLDVTMSETFLRYFRDHSISNNGWSVPKADQKFSRDQLVPLLYLLGAVAAYQPALKSIGTDIMKSLSKLEEDGKPLSNSPQGKIGRNIGYMIDVLADNARYGINYRTSDLPAYLVPCLGNINCAKGNRRKVYKKMFGWAIQAHQLAGWVQGTTGLEVSDEYSVFNALGAGSLQCIAWGKDDSDVKEWRAHFKMFADDGWGPAFRLVAGRSVTDADIDVYYTSYMTRDLDNDIIIAQRPGKIKNGEFQPGLLPGPDRWLLLDYVILKGLRALWG
jgi:hypothetical protein